EPRVTFCVHIVNRFSHHPPNSSTQYCKSLWRGALDTTRLTTAVQLTFLYVIPARARLPALAFAALKPTFNACSTVVNVISSLRGLPVVSGARSASRVAAKVDHDHPFQRVLGTITPASSTPPRRTMVSCHTPGGCNFWSRG
ncbi:unnamed protein product, partial [Ectocarpus sp. 12 AP-2014]